MSNKTFEFTMGWFGRPVANLRFNGVSFQFDYESGWLMPLETAQRAPGHFPAFMDNFLPNDLVQSPGTATQERLAQFIATHERYLSNVSMVLDRNRLAVIPVDRLHGRIEDFSDESHVFNGRVKDFLTLTRDMMADLHSITAAKRLMEVSGAQAKFPMHLDEKGDLSLATDLASTHILKLPGLGHDPHALRGAIEWASMSMAKGGGVKCAGFALIELDGEPKSMLAYLTQRFDIPTGPEDHRSLFAEELGSALGLSLGASDMADLNEIIAGVRKVSTNAREDGQELFRQVVANYLLENADFHCRNISVLKVAEPTLDGFRSVRMAPAYDIMRTHYFSRKPLPEDEREPMRMSFFNEDGDDLTEDMSVESLLEIAKEIGIPEAKAARIVEDTTFGIARTASALSANLPEVFDRYEVQREYVLKTFEAALQCCKELIPEVAQDPECQAGSAPRRPHP